MSKQKGFTLIEGLLILLVVAIIGFGGWYIWNKNQDKEAQQPGVAQEQQNHQDDMESDDITYTNEEFGFAFTYPKKYGTIFETSRSDTEGKNSTLYVFQAQNPCEGCASISSAEDVNYFTLKMTSPGLFEMGATNKSWGGIGTGRPYAAGEGFDSTEANFTAVNTSGLLTTKSDELHNQTTTRIEFNLTKSPEATGFEFMTNDKPGESTNAENLKSIAKTFTLLE